jgi:tetratricopeptide (TPR) repeat protein
MQELDAERARRDLRKIREYLNQGNLEAAAASAEAASLRFRDMAAAWYWRAMVEQLANRHVTAVAHINTAIALDPERPEFFAILARSQLTRGDTHQAVASAMRAVALNPTEVPILDALAQVLQFGGVWEQALMLIERGLEQAPRQLSLLLTRAFLLRALERPDAAEAAFEAALEVQPLNGRAHWGLAQIGGWTRERNHLERLNALAAQLPADGQRRCWIDYARYLEYEELGEDASAIDALLRAAAGQRRLIDYNSASNARIFACMKELLADCARGADRVHVPTAVDAAPIPIFIVGMPRSGTSLVEAMLGRHAEVQHAGESREFATCVQRVLGVETEGFLDETIVKQLHGIDWTAVGKLYRDRLRGHYGERGFVTEKLPANYIFAAAIARALPEARLVRVVREPMDNCFSMFRQMYAGVNPFSFDQLEMAQHYVAYEDWMRQIGTALPDRLLSLRYEQLVGAPVLVGRALYRFCGLEWQDGFADPSLFRRPIALASAARVVEPLHDRCVGRWRRYEAALEPMHRTLAAAGLGPRPLP